MGCIWNLVSIVLFLVDLGTDIYVAVKHRQNGDEVWFRLSLIFIGTPFVIGIFVACCQRLCGVKDLETIVASARYIEAVYESAPQWCLQVYIMLHQWKFPWYTLISIVFSLLGLTWSTVTLEIQILKDEYHNFLFVVVSFFQELFGLTARLVIVAVFAYVFGGLLFVALAVHSLVLVAILYCMEYCECFGSENYSDLCKCFGLCTYFLSVIISYLFFPFVLHPTKAVFALFSDDEERAKTYHACIYILIVVGNIIMLTLVAEVPPREVTHMDVVAPFAMGCVIGGTIANLLLLVCRQYVDDC